MRTTIVMLRLMASLAFLGTLYLLDVRPAVIYATAIAIFMIALIYYIYRIIQKSKRVMVPRKTVVHLHRFVLKPGHINSVYDGETHWISAGQLIKLYQLHHNEFILWDKHYRFQKSDILLTPLRDGNYLQHKEHLLDRFYQTQHLGV